MAASAMPVLAEMQQPAWRRKGGGVVTMSGGRVDTAPDAQQYEPSLVTTGFAPLAELLGFGRMKPVAVQETDNHYVFARCYSQQRWQR